MKDLMFLGMPWLFAAAFVFFVFMTIVTVFKSAQVVSYFTYHQMTSEGKWKPTRQDIIRKCNSCVLLKTSQFAIYGLIMVYLIKIESLFMQTFSEMLRLLAFWYIPAFCLIWLFAFVVTQVYSIYYIKKQIKKRK